MAGLTPTGFDQKSLEEILTEIETEQLATIGPALNQEATSIVGQINGIFAAKLAELWEVALAVYQSAYPDGASGVPLDNVAAITGAVRLPATKSAVVLRCSGTPGTILPVGRVASAVPAGDRFASVSAAVIGGGGFVDVPFQAEQFGPIIANAGTVTAIETPVAGWASVTNILDAIVGRNVETDADFRQRRLLLLTRSGDATVDAIRADVLAVAGVTACFVYENTSLVTDVDGVPAKAFETVVIGGTNQDVGEAIFASKPAGIHTYGNTFVTVTDSQGFDHTINFTRPVQRNLELQITVDRDAATFPLDGSDQIKNALVAFVNALPIGADVIRNELFGPIFEIAGVDDVTVLTTRLNPPGGAFVAANQVIGSREKVNLQTTAITITLI